jgi:excisionase family DNA binding protein
VEHFDLEEAAQTPVVPNTDSQLSSGNLLTVRDVARMLRVPISWVYDHTRPGCRDPLPYLKLGKYVRFQATEIQAYLEDMSRNGR